ncbi:MAG: hypothetical protein J5716_08100 [Alphaproteobacteria bacterium]|nr:hypothetical protein [Alphaproteobacteria bacterium]
MTAVKMFLSERKNRLPLIFMTLLFVLICSAAWVGDDAFIGLRTVKHFLQGHGWRYNISERVQTFTNPLWIICITIAAAITREYYFTLLFLNLSTTAAALYLFYFRQEKSVKQLIFCSVLLFFSTAFKDYATSGLENSLGYLLSALFFLRFFSKTTFDDKDIFCLSLVTGLTLLNRMDTILIVFPALSYACLRCYNGKKKRLFFLVFSGLSPFILWEIFCIIYYGFPFPNTYYTKLQTSIPLNEYLIRGWWYYEYSFLFDIVTLFGIAAGLFAMFYKPADFRFIATGIGIVLYLLYILYIGGDFMAGRFFSVPFFVSVFVFPYNRLLFKSEKQLGFSILCLSVPITQFLIYPSTLSCWLPWNTRQNCFLERKTVGDEKHFWHNITRKKKMTLRLPLDFRLKQTMPVRFYATAGLLPFNNDGIHIVDSYGLTDSLLARLPLRYDNWRTGHILRSFPKGYRETLLSGKNMIEDKETALYYDKLKEIISAPLFSETRFKNIFELNVKNKRPSVKNKNAFYVFYPDAFSVDFNEMKHSNLLSLEMECISSQLAVSFINTKENVSSFVSDFVPPSTKKIYIEVPEEIKTIGFDQIKIAPPVLFGKAELID